MPKVVAARLFLAFPASSFSGEALDGPRLGRFVRPQGVVLAQIRQTATPDVTH